MTRKLKIIIPLLMFPYSLLCGPVPHGNISGKDIAKEVNRVIGTKYVYGGNSLKKGIDCSALVKETYKKFGFTLPRRAVWQVMNLPSCPTYTNLSDVKIGDSVYFKNKKKGLHHVAIVTGFALDGTPIITHAKGKGLGVLREKMNARYKKEFYGAKRFYECNSVLRGDYSDPEVASAIVFASNKFKMDSEDVFRLIFSINPSFDPLVIAVSDKDIPLSFVSSIGKFGVSTTKTSSFFILHPKNIATAKNIALALKDSDIPFRAGLTLLPSSRIKNIKDIFYVLPNIESFLRHASTTD